ncbi:MAG: twin-arginine translocation signal domain-containing protein, partial [Verrucomicrobiia bacterium]
MDAISRRRFLGTCLAATASGWLADRSTAAPMVKLPVLGKVAPRDSLAIAASPLSVGFETLD